MVYRIYCIKLEAKYVVECKFTAPLSHASSWYWKKKHMKQKSADNILSWPFKLGSLEQRTISICARWHITLWITKHCLHFTYKVLHRIMTNLQCKLNPFIGLAIALKPILQGGHILWLHEETKFPEFSLRFPGYFQIFPWATQ